MECKKCGYENTSGAKFCQGCGAPISSDNEEREQQHNNYYQPQKKKNTGLIVTVIILSVLAVAAIVTIVLILVLGGSGDKKESNNSNSNNNNYNYNYNNNNNNNNNSNSGDTLVCSATDSSGSAEITYYFDKYNTVKSVSAVFTLNNSTYADSFETLAEESGVPYRRSGNKFYIDDYSTYTNSNVIGKTKTEVIEGMDDVGYYCVSK